MNSFRFSLSLLFLLIFSCKNVSSTKHEMTSDNLQQVQKIFDTTKWEANTIDTFNYANLPYWNEKRWIGLIVLTLIHLLLMDVSLDL